MPDSVLDTIRLQAYGDCRMSFLLACPNCGVREVTDFGFGGEVSERPKTRPEFRDLSAYNYFRRNTAGVQREWWYHRSGCRAWFIAERNTSTNEVLFTARPSEVAGAPAAPGDGAEPTGTSPGGVA
jgi:heterotetrameric sarcosine oxidase delta subunit